MSDEKNRPTVQDPGWRNRGENDANATMQDPGWRNRGEDDANATMQDPGWRNRGEDDANATMQDPGWRDKVSDMAGIVSGSAANVPNRFATIREFKDAVEKLTSFTSSKGTVYTVKRTISRSGGEAMVLLCSDPDGNDVVAKVYYEPLNGNEFSRTARSFVLDYMATDEGKKYTLAVTDYGVVEDFPPSKYYFEIMPYCPGADLSAAGALSFDHIVKVVDQLNEILHSIHSAKIIHRDIKPDNLYELDGQLKLGDFGIARNGADGKITKNIAGTEGYAAPETRRYIIRNASDYYSMGVTLATLFEGHFVFENMTYEMQVLSQDNESLPLTRLDPNREQLENLLNGLCRIDYRLRFGYEDVKRWLADHDYTGTVVYDSANEWPHPFRPNPTESYRDERSLFEGITKDEAHWEEAKRILYTKHFESFFGSFRTDLAMAAQSADDTYRNANNDKGLAVFLKALYPAGPIVWRGHTFRSLSELGNRIIGSKNPVAYAEIFENRCISHWLENSIGIDRDPETVRIVRDIEQLSVKDPVMACYWYANSFADERSLYICGKTVKTISELNQALFSSPSDFYQGEGYDKLCNPTEGAALYGFLYSFGFKELMDQAWVKMAKCDEFNKAAILFAMMDDITVKTDSDPAILRSFFVSYGPVGIATYTKTLVEKGEAVYIALDGDGRRALSDISGFKMPALDTVDAMFRAYTPLMESVDRLLRVLEHNPYNILTGVYDKKGVICGNLMGCFAFRIFGRMAPLGFNALLESANGGKK